MVMNLALATQAVLEELTRMRSEGVNRIYIQEHTLNDLEASDTRVVPRLITRIYRQSK